MTTLPQDQVNGAFAHGAPVTASPTHGGVIPPHGGVVKPQHGMEYTTGAAPFDPGDLFAASDGYYIDPSDNASVPDAVDATVQTIADLSGNGNHASQPVAGSRGTRRFSGGIYSIELDGTADFYAFAAGMISAWTAGTVIFAAKANADPGPGQGHLIAHFGQYNAEYYPFSDGIDYCAFLTSARKTCGDPGNLAVWHINEYRSEANNFRAARNGVEYFSTVTNTVQAGDAGQAQQIGAGIGGFFAGHFGRIICIDRILTGTELANARTWVAAGAGIVL